MDPEAISKLMADLARDHAPEVTFSPAVQVGDATVICASSVSCLAGGRGPNLVVTLRSTPCAVIVFRPGECSVLPIGDSGLAERLLDLTPRLLDLLPARLRGVPANHAPPKPPPGSPPTPARSAPTSPADAPSPLSRPCPLPRADANTPTRSPPASPADPPSAPSQVSPADTPAGSISAPPADTPTGRGA